MDLTLKFDTQAISEAIGEVMNRECVVLTLTGNFKEEYLGGPIVGEDVIIYLNPGTSRPTPVSAGDLGDRLENLVPLTVNTP
ncbi:MAG: hypothetical protein JSV80_11925 [Acidobacteriota bacterium]|nr:MAG: hypothetical protein JSV80_11925 [Acidobacteriota bacterium]